MTRQFASQIDQPLGEHADADAGAHIGADTDTVAPRGGVSSSLPPVRVLMAGGGSGGHIFPNIAIAERLAGEVESRWPGRGFEAHFLVSKRPVDQVIGEREQLTWHPMPAAPLSVKPKGLWHFVNGYRQTVGQTRKLIQQLDVSAVVGTGGFVTGPVADCAVRRGLPVALVSLDAVPGKSNRLSAWQLDKAVKRGQAHVLSTFQTPMLPEAQVVGMPLRQASVPKVSQVQAKLELTQRLGVDAQRPVMLVTAGSQGLRSTNDTVTCLLEQAKDLFAASVLNAGDAAKAKPWLIIHLSGQRDEARVAEAYRQAGVGVVDATDAGGATSGQVEPHAPQALVLPFCDCMGLAWAAADVAVSLAGAGSVAEAWANAVPTVFFPYPYHRDQHQKINAQPAVATGGALLLTDTLDAADNAARLKQALTPLIQDAAKRQAMREKLLATCPEDGAQVVAQWVCDRIGGV